MKFLKYIFCLAIGLQFLNCVQDTHKKTISISVDMNNEVSHSEVGVRGNYPLSWDETTYLKDDDEDGIYEGEFEFYTASNAIQFKFVNHDHQFELQDQNNRSLYFEYNPETIKYSAIFNNPNSEIKKQ